MANIISIETSAIERPMIATIIVEEIWTESSFVLPSDLSLPVIGPENQDKLDLLPLSRSGLLKRIEFDYSTEAQHYQNVAIEY